MGFWSLFVSGTATLCVLAVLAAVWLDFRRYGGRDNTRREQHSPVATGTMLLFFLGYYLVLRLNLGIWMPSSRTLRLWMIGLGLVMVVAGTVINLWGRVVLGRNWANQIKIYDNHTLVTSGPFRYLRHPLYSSLMLMAYGGCLLYSNWLGVLLTSAAFVPMMNYRAAQEEVLLKRAFPEYEAYCQKAGRFLPVSLSGCTGLNGAAPNCSPSKKENGKSI